MLRTFWGGSGKYRLALPGLIIVAVGVTLFISVLMPASAPKAEIKTMDAQIAANVFATLTAVAPLPPATITPSDSDARPAEGVTAIATPFSKDKLVDFMSALGTGLRRNAALSADFERWYAKVKDRLPTSAEINEYGTFLERRSALFNEIQALPKSAELLEIREQWMDAFKKRYDAELVYFRLLMESDPRSRRALYDRFVSAILDADRAYSSATGSLVIVLESSSIGCVQVKMCVNDLGR